MGIQLQTIKSAIQTVTITALDKKNSGNLLSKKNLISLKRYTTYKTHLKANKS